MTEVFVIRNQLGHYWGKSKTWVDGRDARAVARLKHEDEGINTLVELSARDIELRGSVVPVELGERGEPMLEISTVPLPPTAEDTQAALPGTADTAGAEANGRAAGGRAAGGRAADAGTEPA